MENDTFPCAKLLLAVTGSFHSTQIPQYLIGLKTSFAADIRVMMTESAVQMCAPRAIEVIIDHRVETDLWGSADMRAPHVRAVRWADLFVVLPATANVMAKAAHGIADDLVSTTIAATEEPIVFAPAMNPSMWHNPAVQRNIARLRDDGHYIIPPRTIISVTTGQFDEGLGPTPETVLPHLWHVSMRRRQRKYWAEATASPPRTPSTAPARRTVALAANSRRAGKVAQDAGRKAAAGASPTSSPRLGASDE